MVPLEALCSTSLIPPILITADHLLQREKTRAVHGPWYICVLSSHCMCGSYQELLSALKKNLKKHLTTAATLMCYS